MLIEHILKSTPSVACEFSFVVLCKNVCSKHDFPTPEFPISIILNVYS